MCKYNVSKEYLALSVYSMLMKDAQFTNLWKLDLLGINVAIEKQSKIGIDRQVKKKILVTDSKIEWL